MLGRLSIVPAQHFKEMDDGAIMMLTSISAWNRSSAKYLYINLTEEEAAKAQVVVCDTEGTPCMNCLTELLNRVGADRDRRAVQREAAILSKIEQDKQTELEPIRTAVAENKTAIDNQNKAVDEKLAQWNESVKESIEQALQVQNSNWRGKTINFIGDSITYGAYTPVGGSSPNKRAEKRYCEIACERFGRNLPKLWCVWHQHFQYLVPVSDRRDFSAIFEYGRCGRHGRDRRRHQ